MAQAVETQPRNLPLLTTPETCSGGTFYRDWIRDGQAPSWNLAPQSSAGEEAKAQIEAATRKVNVAEVWALDLTSYDSVKAFAKKAEAELDRIDALIENAGLAASQRTLAEGHLVTVTVNVLSTLLLAVLLLPKISESAWKFAILPHIVFVTSRVGFEPVDMWEQIKDDPLVKMDDEKMVVLRMYPLSKLVETMAVRHLATLLPVSRSGVVMNLVCPGVCKTALNWDAPPAFRKSLDIRKENYVWGCRGIAEDVVPSWVTGEEGNRSQKRTWEVIASELEAVEPGCLEKILQI